MWPYSLEEFKRDDHLIKSVTHGQCDAKPTVAFPVVGRRPLASINLYCLVTEACVYEQPTQGCYLTLKRPQGPD